MKIMPMFVLVMCLFPHLGIGQNSVIYGQLLRKGNTAYSKGQYIEAEIEYRKALDAFPGGADASFNLGNALFKQGRYDQAINMFEAGIDVENSPQMKARALYNLGTAHLAREDYPAAAEALKNSLRIDPNQEDTRHNLAVAVKQQQAQEQQDSEQNKEEQQQSSQEEQQDEQEQETEDPAEDAPEDAPPSDQPPSRPMTPEEADQMLRRLEFQEQQVQQQIRQRQQKNRIRGEKDW